MLKLYDLVTPLLVPLDLLVKQLVLLRLDLPIFPLVVPRLLLVSRLAPLRLPLPAESLVPLPALLPVSPVLHQLVPLDLLVK